jgi:magnesium chelatase family protein
MLVKVYGSAVYGVEAMSITIEADAAPGLGYVIVGLPDNAVKESVDRILSALKNNQLIRPRTKIVINMAPADIKKAGSAYDLPIAIAMLGATEQVATKVLPDFVIMGELSLDGALKPVKGVLPMAIQAKQEGFRGMILPEQNAREAAMVAGLEVYGASSLGAVIAILNGDSKLEKTHVDTRGEFYEAQAHFDIDFNEVKGQEHIKGLWRLPLQVVTMLFSSGRLVPVKPCWPKDCQRYCRRFLYAKHWKQPKSILWRAPCRNGLR